VPITAVIFSSSNPLSERYKNYLKSTQVDSGIRKFTNKFSSPQINGVDVLLRVHDMAERYKELSWASFILASKANMLAILPEGALVVSRDPKIPRKYECPQLNLCSTVPINLGRGSRGTLFMKLL
jgi:hypothetical protein